MQREKYKEQNADSIHRSKSIDESLQVKRQCLLERRNTVLVSSASLAVSQCTDGANSLRLRAW